MNAIEQLMVEHAALRLHFRLARQVQSSDVIYEIEDFVRNCHAKIEDELIFPKLREIIESPNKEQLNQAISRLEADHKMIDTIGDQIKLRTTQGDADTLRKRILLYMSTVESHNSSEESLIFPYWKINESEERVIVSKARKTIQEFGLNRYFSITGISEKLFDKIV